MDLYSTTSLAVSKTITRAYTSSFYAGMKLLSREMRKAIYAIYGFVRIADEIVDSFHGHDQERLLKEFKAETFRAIERGVSANPVLHSYQRVVNQYQIDRALTESFFTSMEMDLVKINHDPESYNQYIYGSAEVVGLMCLSVFYPDDKESYNAMAEPARKLGEAFQKINFLRDIRSDRDERNRIYFPGLEIDSFDRDMKRTIEKEIKADFREALSGIRKLHREARLGVYLAYRYYYQLLLKIEKLSPEQLLSGRTSVGKRVKYLLLLKAYIRFRLGLI
ncbi:MAG: phytoene/squalene synthase family protein [Bacteroidales bacterium]|nr:phytoene/squalene synthase family protein [Bacteroidales bacterium]